MVTYSEEWARALEAAVEAAEERASEEGEDPWGIGYDGCWTCTRRLEWRMVMEATLKGAAEGLVSL